MTSPKTSDGYTNGQNANSLQEPPHIFVFDSMRTRSHLFWRWMTTYPSLSVSYHPYLMAGFLGPERVTQGLRHSEKREGDIQGLIKASPTKETFATSTESLRRQVEQAEKEGKRLFTNEHGICFMEHEIQYEMIRNGDKAFPSFDHKVPNPLYTPDTLLDKFTPIILIRHPVFQVDSVYRAMIANSELRPEDEDFDMITSTRQSRWIFEYFRHARGGRIPIVVDGEDVLWRTQDLGNHVCHALDLDPSALKEKWDCLPQEQRHPNWFVDAMTATMHQSTGIERPAKQPSEPNLNQAVRKWTEDYGVEIAGQLKQKVEAAMPQYEYLVQFKL